jgi:exosortase E/protease (VPEID-CTERM system)
MQNEFAPPVAASPLFVERQREQDAGIPSLLIKRLGILSAILVFESAIYYFTHLPETYRILLTRWALLAVVLFVVLGYPKIRATLGSLSRESIGPVSFPFLALHACTMAMFLWLSSPGPTTRFAGNPIVDASFWFTVGTAAVLFAAVSLVPSRIWSSLLWSQRKLGIFAMFAAWLAYSATRPLWDTFGADLTFWLVQHVLHPFLPTLLADTPERVIGSGQFAVRIDSSCSGWEGLGLVAIFSVLSLWLSRRDYRFPAAFVLIPAALMLAFALNAVRISLLLMIGLYGHPDIAIRGFHSQAGWIAFSCVAVAIVQIAPRVRWLRLREQPVLPRTDRLLPNPVVPFLLPFAVTLAAGMVSVATSDGFEWLYPLRLFAAAAVLWYFRRQYGFLKWKLAWFPLLAGAAAFAVWLALDRGSPAGNGVAAGLAKMSVFGRVSWLSFRTLAAVITVPLAEELAFRGFLFRRLISAEFEAVAFSRFSYIAIVISSLAFGLLHGERWIAATIAGLLYSVAMLRRGRLSDAVVAHAVTNGLLAGWVILGRHWYLW